MLFGTPLFRSSIDWLRPAAKRASRRRPPMESGLGELIIPLRCGRERSDDVWCGRFGDEPKVTSDRRSLGFLPVDGCDARFRVDVEFVVVVRLPGIQGERAVQPLE